MDHRTEERAGVTALVGTAEGPARATAPPDTALVSLVQQALEASPEPLTAARLNTLLPRPYCQTLIEQLLIRQVIAGVLFEFPSYRGQPERYWVRPMTAHVADLIGQALTDGPLAWSEIRRRLPGYAKPHAVPVLQQMLAAGTIYQHPRVGRGGPRFGTRPADITRLLRDELARLFLRLERRGFCPTQLRVTALEVLHEEQWAEPAPGAETCAHVDAADGRPAGARHDVGFRHESV